MLLVKIDSFAEVAAVNQIIIIIQEKNILTVAMGFKSLAPIMARALVGLVLHKDHPRIITETPAHEFCRAIAGAVVNHCDLLMRVILPQDALNGLVQEVFSIISSNNYTDFGESRGICG
ncbi:hypothetical protein D3C81_1477730 [compost metagenome]